MTDYSELKRLAEAFPADLDWDSNTEPFFNGPSGESLGGGATGFYSVYGKPFRLEGEDYDYDGPTYVEACSADFAKFMVAAREGMLALIAENEGLKEKYEAARDRTNSITLLKMQNDQLKAENEELREDLEHARREPLYSTRLAAERYRWLRAQTWDASPIAVVVNPKSAVKLGHDCPSGIRLDQLVDSMRLVVSDD